MLVGVHRFDRQADPRADASIRPCKARSLVHQVCQQAGDMYILRLLEVLEDRLKHIPR